MSDTNTKEAVGILSQVLQMYAPSKLKEHLDLLSDDYSRSKMSAKEINDKVREILSITLNKKTQGNTTQAKSTQSSGNQSKRTQSSGNQAKSTQSSGTKSSGAQSNRTQSKRTQ